MGGAARLSVVFGLVLPVVASAVCEPTADGVVVEARDGALWVAALAGGSPAARAGVRVGDVVRQVNGERPAVCESWRAMLTDAAERGIAVLLLAERGGTTRVAALATPALGRADTSPEPVATDGGAGGRATPAPRPVPAGPRDLLPDDVAVTRAGVVSALAALGPEGRERLEPYRSAVDAVQRMLTTLLVRDPATENAGALLRLLRLHEGAVIAWDAVEAIRARQGLRATMPVSAGATESFFRRSDVARLLEDVPVLARAVRRWPGTLQIETAGLWEPMRARGLLWAEADAVLVEVVGGRRQG